MRYTNLGRSGLKISRVGLGSWLTFGLAVDLETTRACVRAAVECGCIFFDTADVYGKGQGERTLGAALSDHRRRDYVLASKVFGRMSTNPNDRGLSRKHVIESCEQSLSNLGTDYLDLYQCHRFDTETPLEEVVDAMGDLVRQGKILYWGTSDWTTKQLADAIGHAERRNGYRPIANQPNYSLLEQQAEVELIRARELGVGQLAFSPLAQGILTGKYSSGQVPAGSRASDPERGGFLKKVMTPANLDRAARVAALARELSFTPAQLALAWCLRKDLVAGAITGATRPEQITENMAAGDIILGEDAIQALERILDDEFLG